MADPDAQTSGSKESKPETQRLSTEQALAGSRRVAGVSPHIMAGALAGTDRATHTPSQLEKAARDFAKEPEDADGNWDAEAEE